MKPASHFSSAILAILVSIFFSIKPCLLNAQADSARIHKLVMKKEAFFMKKNVPLENYTFNDPVINLKLKEAVRYHRKSENKFLIGTVLASLGLIGIIAGITSETEVPEPGVITWEIGPNISDEAIGGILLAGSLPFFMMAESNNVKMKRSLAEAKSLMVE